MKKVLLFLFLYHNSAFAQVSSDNSQNAKVDNCQAPAFEQLKMFDVSANIKNTGKKDYSTYKKNIERHQDAYFTSKYQIHAINKMLKKDAASLAQLPILKEKMRQAESHYKSEIQKICAEDVPLCESYKLKERSIEETFPVYSYQNFETFDSKRASIKDEPLTSLAEANKLFMNYDPESDKRIIRERQKLIDRLHVPSEEKERAKIDIEGAHLRLAQHFGKQKKPVSSEKLAKNSKFHSVRIYKDKNEKVLMYSVGKKDGANKPDLLVSLKSDCSLQQAYIGDGKSLISLTAETCQLDSYPFGSPYKASACRMLADQGAFVNRAPSSNPMPSDFRPYADQEMQKSGASSK